MTGAEIVVFVSPFTGLPYPPARPGSPSNHQRMFDPEAEAVVVLGGRWGCLSSSMSFSVGVGAGETWVAPRPRERPGGSTQETVLGDTPACRATSAILTN
ncbi:MAG: hypothetical protein QOE54_131 [Streptosporangiaceae bacterium]|nr:hypothetical protein [Streptosporangiaceae bacterium]